MPGLLEDELAAITASVLKQPRRAEAVLLSYGGASGDPATLGSVAARSGYSREGVRHILLEFSIRVPRISRPVATLERALDLMAELAPCLEREYGEALIARGVARGAFPCAAVLQWARTLKCGTPLPVVLAAGGVLIPAGLTDLYRRLPGALRKLTGNLGVAQVDRCAARLSQLAPGAPLRRLIAVCVECDDSFRWIDAGSGWFWVPEGRNPLLSDVRKLLSVCPSLEIESLHAGVSRFYRRHGSVPPPEILLAWFRQVEGLRVSDALIAADPPLDPREELTGEELRVYELLRAHGGRMPASDLQRELVAQGGNVGTLRVLRMNTPFICRVSSKVYALRTPGLPGGGRDFGYEERGGRHVRTAGWSPDGCVRLSYRLTPRQTHEAQFRIPYVHWKVLRGEFRLLGPDGQDLGRVEARVPGGIRLDALFAGGRAEEGMVLDLEFDLPARSVRAALRERDTA